MKKRQEERQEKAPKKKLLVRKDAIRRLDDRELSIVVGGAEPPIIGDGGPRPGP